MRSRKSHAIALIVLGLTIGSTPAKADSFSTSYVDILDGYVEPGREVPLRDSTAQDLILTNDSDVSVTVNVQPLIPSAAQMKPGSEPIPDLRWIRIDPSTFQIAPHAKGTCKVLVTVPRDKKYRHHCYQIMIWSRAHRNENSGAAVTAGLLSRGRFLVGTPKLKKPLP